MEKIEPESLRELVIQFETNPLGSPVNMVHLLAVLHMLLKELEKDKILPPNTK